MPSHVDDAVDSVNEESLGGPVVFGNDDIAAAVARLRASADGHREIHHGYGLAAQVGHPANDRMAFRQLNQRWTLDDLLHLEYVDSEALVARELEQQQLQAIMPRKLGSLIYAFE